MAGSEQHIPRSTTEQVFSGKTSLGGTLLPSKNAAEEFVRPGKRPRLEPPPPMTAAAAIADARHRSKSPLVATEAGSEQTSPNPAAQALGALMGVSHNAISQAYTSTDNKTQDPTKKVSEGLAVAVEHLQPRSSDSTTTGNDQNTQTSPTSVSSFDTQDSVAAPSGISTTVASPLPIETLVQQSTPTVAGGSTSPDDNPSAASLPPPLLQPQNDGRRGMSLPHSGLRQNTRSPSSRKHRCPYCSTEFTRHHNLKSHLLTHSQEKPYVCSTCQSRFRRLHDLKRHTKLHTGERPHVCPKCNRKFARGDALARHTKGPGGCAGRRASMGSFAGEEDYDGADDMEGVMYGEPESMEDIEGDASKGTPSIRRQAPSGDDTMDDQDHYSRLPSTYPPIQGRPPGGIASGQFPPRSGGFGQSQGTSSSNATSSGPPTLPYPASGSSSSLRPSQSGSQLFPQNSITESPKPISPSQPQNRMSGSSDNRIQSPNTSQFQPPQTYSRTMSNSGPTLATPVSAPQLPPPHGLNPPDSRYTLPSQGAPTHPPTQPSGPPTHMSGSGPLSSHSNSLSSHGQSGHGSGDANSMFNKDERIWAFVKDLERKMALMQDEINSLKTQLVAATSQQATRT